MPVMCRGRYKIRSNYALASTLGSGQWASLSPVLWKTLLFLSSRCNAPLRMKSLGMNVPPHSIFPYLPPTHPLVLPSKVCSGYFSHGISHQNSSGLSEFMAGEGEEWGDGRDRNCLFEREMERKGLRLEAEERSTCLSSG